MTGSRGTALGIVERRPGMRDHAAKLLALLDFSSAKPDPETLDDTLGVFLLSLMGEFTAPGGVILLRSEGDDLIGRVAKGAGGLRLVGCKIPLGEVSELEPVLTDALACAHPLAPLAEPLPGALLVPIRHRQRLLGVVALARRVSRQPYAPEEIELVRLVGQLAGTVVANARLYDELSAANRKLRRGIFDLHTVFDVSRELNACLEPESIYRIVAQTAMAHVLVSQCLILMADEGALRVVFSRGRSPSAAAGEPVLDLEAFQAEAGVRLIPIRVASSTRGFLAIGERKDARVPSQEDIEFLSTLGHQAITALDNLKLHRDRAVRERLERELAIAREIQAGLFPRVLPSIPGYEVAARSESCFEVGGDYYDVFPSPRGILLAVGDVAGKSIPAALLMSVLQATLRSLADRGESASALLASLHRRLFESTQPEKFATFFLGLLDPGSGRLAYASAGHPAPIRVKANGTVEPIALGGLPLGLFEEQRYEELAIELGPGELLCVYTDGVTEAQDAQDEPFGDDALQSTLAAQQGASASGVIEAVVAAVRAHANGLPSSDDLTILALRRLGA